MNAPQNNSVRERFEWDAQNFDAIYRLERSPFSRWFNKIFRKAIFERYDITFKEAGDIKDKAILDIGCGSGVYSTDFARRGARRVVGIDFSKNMLEIATKEAVKHNVAERCEFIHHDFMTFETTDLFDISIAMGVFDYLDNPAQFLRKMVSITTKKVIVSFPGHSLIREPLRQLRYSLTGRGNVFFYHEDDIKRIAVEAGVREYRIIKIYSSGRGYILVSNC